MSLRSVGAVVGVNAERVRQIEVSAAHVQRIRAATARFPDLKSGLAVRLAQRFPDVAAVCAADDQELHSLRGVGSVQFAKLRSRYPHSTETALPVRRSLVQDALLHPLESGARPFAPSVAPHR